MNRCRINRLRFFMQSKNCVEVESLVRTLSNACVKMLINHIRIISLASESTAPLHRGKFLLTSVSMASFNDIDADN